MNINEEDWNVYLKHLREIISIKSVFFDNFGIEKCLLYCENIFLKNVPEFRIYRDRKNNLIAISQSWYENKKAIYLSAHVDTVGADASEWLTSENPFLAKETATHVIGRGANDCKAGVAFCLLVSHLIFSGKIQGYNIGFLLSAREEGNEEKTSVAIGEDIGSVIPLSNIETSILVLENTVSLNNPDIVIQLYDKEPCNLFFAVDDNLSNLRRFLHAFPKMKPVYIQPMSLCKTESEWHYIKGQSGHIASTANENNILHKFINSLEGGDSNIVVNFGDINQTSVISSVLKWSVSEGGLEHRIVVNYRGFESLDEVLKNMEAFKISPAKPYKNGFGSDRSEFIDNSRLIETFMSLDNRDIRTLICENPGRSDASSIWNSCLLECKEKLVIATIGPGTRSHQHLGIARKTHGADEGFFKFSGYIAIRLLLGLIKNYIE